FAAPQAARRKKPPGIQRASPASATWRGAYLRRRTLINGLASAGGQAPPLRNCLQRSRLLKPRQAALEFRVVWICAHRALFRAEGFLILMVDEQGFRKRVQYGGLFRR